MSKTAILLIDCPDRKGIVVTIVNFLVQRYDANILNAGQHQDVPEVAHESPRNVATMSSSSDRTPASRRTPSRIRSGSGRLYAKRRFWPPWPSE